MQIRLLQIIDALLDRSPLGLVRFIDLSSGAFVSARTMTGPVSSQRRVSGASTANVTWHGSSVYFTASATLTLPDITDDGIGQNFAITVFAAFGVVVTLALTNATQAINRGTAGASLILPMGAAPSSHWHVVIDTGNGYSV